MSAAPSDAACRRLDHLQRRHARVGPAQGRSPASGEEPVEDPAGRARLHSGRAGGPARRLPPDRQTPWRPVATTRACRWSSASLDCSPSRSRRSSRPTMSRLARHRVRTAARTGWRYAAWPPRPAARLHPPTASIRAPTRRTAMPSAGAARRRRRSVSADRRCGRGGRLRRSRTQRDAVDTAVSERCATGPRGRAARRSADRAAASRLPPGPSRRGSAAARPAGSRGWRSAT